MSKCVLYPYVYMSPLTLDDFNHRYKFVQYIEYNIRILVLQGAL